uniref:Uncharacterized protein n=1 Tax=Arundo donax TaxID=35708 RepID=A0A0A9GPY4_ARUDO
MALMELITAEAVASGTTRRSWTAIAGREATSGAWAGLTAAAGTNVTRSAPAPAASASPPNGSHSPPPPRPKSARSLTPTRPAPSDPSGGPPTQPRAKSVRTKPPSGPPPPPPPPPAAGVPDAEDRRLPREIAHLTYVGAVILGLNNDLENLTSGWVTPAKVVYCGTMMLAIQLLGTGIMADGRLSAICARSGSILSSILLAVSISCRMGRLGWVAGVASSPVIAGTMAAVWMRGEPAAAQAVSRFRGRVVELWRRRQHAAAEAVSSVWGGVVELWRRVPAAGAGVSPPSASGEVLPR